MAGYVRYDNAAELEQVYREIVDTFGKNVFQDKYRTLGIFLDIAPKMKEEANHLMAAFEVGIPQHLSTASALDKAKAEEMIRVLKTKGVSQESAIDFLENLGRAMGLKVNIRPDYSKGGQIPYVSVQGDDLNTAVNNLDHIRWFLNNSNKYKISGLDNEIKNLRKLMNNAQRNEAEIISKYNEIAHEFQNNPFEESFVFDKEPAGKMRSSNFGAYFIVIGGSPVPIEFARAFGGSDYGHSMRPLQAKYNAMMKKVESYQNQLGAIQLGQAKSTGKGKCIAFIVVSIILMLFIRTWLSMRYQGSGLANFFMVLKANHFRIGDVFAGLRAVSPAAPYVVVVIISLLALLCAILLIIGIIRMIIRIGKLGNSTAPIHKKEKLEQAFKTSIPAKVQGLLEQIKNYSTGKQKSLDLSRQDYRGLVKEIESLKGVKVSGGAISVRQGAKTALVWMIILTGLLSILSVTRVQPITSYVAGNLASSVYKSQTLRGSVIPYDALEYNGHYYAVYSDATSYNDAYYHCMKLGGHMATISSEEEDYAIATYIQDKDYDNAFIGMWYTDAWYWWGGEEVVYTDWTEGEPDIGSGDCLYASMSQYDNYRWRALPETSTTHYVCEWESAEAGMIDQRLLNIPMGALNYNGHYYAILDGAETYDDAVKMCEKLDGYMAVIGDEAENYTLYDYMISRGVYNAYFGYSDQELEGKWRWTNEEDATGFTWWNDGEPNNDGGGENFAMFWEYAPAYCWNDANWQGTGDKFICEWNLNDAE